VTDSFIAQPDGGFWVSQMGDSTGGAPGRIVRIAGNRTVLRELPERPPAGFNPHGGRPPASGRQAAAPASRLLACVHT
jgi:hypothetical protein